MLFFLADDWRWAESWIFSAIFFLSCFAIVLYLYFKDPALLNERFAAFGQKDQKSWDKIFLGFAAVGFFAWLALMPLDARRFGWSPPFPWWLKIVGTLLLIFAFLIVFAALKENTFAAPVVKMQKERGQKVISTGAYALVRHPMYLGGILFFVGSPLLLGSLYGLALGILLSVLFTVRIFGEEKMLIEDLEGYADYMRKVRWRLIPFIF